MKTIRHHVLISTAFLGSVVAPFQSCLKAEPIEEVSLQSLGAVGDGKADDTPAFAKAIAAGARVIRGAAGKTYRITQRLYPRSYQTWDGGGATIGADFRELGYRGDIFVIQGGDAPGSEVHHVTIANWTLRPLYQTNVGAGIQVYGLGHRSRPHDFTIENVVTRDFPWGGWLIHRAYRGKISRTSNFGGIRGGGVMAPINDPDSTSDISIENAKTEGTSDFGFQTYYGTRISMHSLECDGSRMTPQPKAGADKSCFTFDRSSQVVARNLVGSHAANDQIYVTGSHDILIENAQGIGGKGGLQINANLEVEEDATIRESRRVTVRNFVARNNSERPLIVNGGIDIRISGGGAYGSGSPAGLIVMSEHVGQGARRFRNQSRNIRISNFDSPGKIYLQNVPSIDAPTVSLSGSRFGDGGS